MSVAISRLVLLKDQRTTSCTFKQTSHCKDIAEDSITFCSYLEVFLFALVL